MRSTAEVSKDCRKLQVSPVMLPEERKVKKKRNREKSIKMVRENEPTPQKRIEEKKEDATPFRNEPRSFGCLWRPLRIKGRELVAAVFRNEKVAPALDVSVASSLKMKHVGNPVSMSDGSSYHCLQGCPGRGELIGAEAMASLKQTPKVAALRMVPTDRTSDDSGQWQIPDLWEKEKFEGPPSTTRMNGLIVGWIEAGLFVLMEKRESDVSTQFTRATPFMQTSPEEIESTVGSTTRGKRRL